MIQVLLTALSGVPRFMFGVELLAGWVVFLQFFDAQLGRLPSELPKLWLLLAHLQGCHGMTRQLRKSSILPRTFGCVSSGM